METYLKLLNSNPDFFKASPNAICKRRLALALFPLYDDQTAGRAHDELEKVGRVKFYALKKLFGFCIVKGSQGWLGP